VTTPRADGGGVLVLGASGMLGHALMHELSDGLGGMSVRGTIRSVDGLPDHFTDRFAGQLIDGVDVLDFDSVASVIAELRPEVVINAVGVIKQAPGVNDAVLTTQLNALLPHLLAQECSARSARLVQISTDCVFSGRTGAYTEDDVPDPLDFYGRSKLVGEVPAPHLTLRTSIIGPELRRGGSLLEWFLSQDGQHTKGFTKAIYSGLPTSELARVIAAVVIPDRDLAGLWHLASAPISKFELLELVASEYGWAGHIEPDDQFVCDRSLSAARFEERTGYSAPSWSSMVREMRAAHLRWSKG